VPAATVSQSLPAPLVVQVQPDTVTLAGTVSLTAMPLVAIALLLFTVML
jgi:hypothetical protein